MSIRPTDAASERVRPVRRPAGAGWRTALVSDHGWGMRVYGAAALTLGLFGLIWGDFTVGFHPVPEATPGRALLAYACAVLFILSALGLQQGRTRTLAGGVVGLLYLAFALCWSRRVVAAPLMIGTWLGTAEQLLLAVGALAVAAQAGPAGRTTARVCRLAFGACEIVFGLAHFLSLPETIAMTPAWAPLGQTFWALATGAAHMVAGLALIMAFFPVVTTRLMATMFAVFGALVWLPALLDDPGSRFAWAGNAINLALVGAALAIGDLLGRARPALVSQAAAPNDHDASADP